MFKRILLGFLIVLGLPEFALANCDGAGPCYCYGAVCTNTPPPNNSNSSGDSDYDDGGAAARRRAQAAEAARRAEEQRRQEAELEQQRINAENKRRMEEIANQAKFIDERNAAASTLRGSTGATSGGSTGSLLRGSTGTGATSDAPMLRGSGMDTGLRGLKSDTAPAPNLDPMVVDARNVPSGLPKSVDDAIPHTPSGERVRKGFEAIQAGDWKAALAWFKDARNKEPGNPGLSRLVDLAQFTLEYRTRAQTPAVEKNFTVVKSSQLPKQNSKNDSADGTEDKSSVAYSVASSVAARARAEAAFKKYTEKYGERDIIGRTRAAAKASRGDGYSNEELQSQLQKALLDYRKKHGKGKFDGVGGSPSADEIAIGGKG